MGASSLLVSLSCSLPKRRLAARPVRSTRRKLARDGDPEPGHIEENDTSFVIDWKGNYRIEGPAYQARALSHSPRIGDFGSDTVVLGSR